MTQGEKDLVLKDLCARLPYKVKVCLYEKETCVLLGIDGYEVYLDVDSDSFRIESIKPYLRPMSNMTKDEEDELDKIDKESSRIFFDDLFERKKKEGRENLKGFLPDYPTLDWLNSHHFDYRGLINMRLALEAPEGMYTTT